MIDKFLKDNDIDVRALDRIKHRLFIVGRFNQRNQGPYPDLYLFTNRTGLPERYRQNFTQVLGMRYDNFVAGLRPAIAEKVIPGRIPMVLQVVPQGGEAADASSIIDTFNFFFQRAVANSDQKAFEGAHPGLPKELLRETERERGKGIFKLIRENLNVFSTFQPRTHEIIDAASKLLGTCGKENSMPPYASGGGLPGGFPERLIDFLYAEDTRELFSTDGLDLSSEPWSELQRNEEARRMFCNVVSAFRDALLGRNDQFSIVRFRNRTLNQQARAVLSDELVEEFGRARDAFNGLRQILRSKVLLSMVLEWLLDAYYDIDDVKVLGSGADAKSKDEAVEKAILSSWEANHLAKPIKRASPEERRKFSNDLTANFERLLKTILADDAGSQKLMQELPQEIRSLAAEVRRNPERKRILAGISGSEFGGDYEAAFIEASKVVLLDVLCPALFQVPILSAHMLRQFFRQETMAAYLTAVFLANDSQDAVRKIADDHIGYLQKKIDNATIRDAAEVQEHLLRSFIDVLAKPEIQRRLNEGVRVLNEAHTLLDNATFEMPAGQDPGAGRIAAIRPDPAYGKSPALDRTEIKDKDVTVPLENVVRRQVEKVLEKATASLIAKSAAQGAAGQANASAASATQPGDSSQAAGSSAANPRTSEEPVRPSQIEQNADGAISKVMARLFPSVPAEELKRSQQLSLVETASKELINEPGLVAKVKRDVQAFEQALYLIYRRYNENVDKKSFRNRVERMTLINMMLLFQKDLGLGQVCSNLYHLLLDLVQHLDPENPDPKAFLAEKSLTIYFDNAVLANGGITDLRETLEAQAHLNLQATVDFVSELRGVKYLMDVVAEDQEAEIIVVNATATEFLDWLTRDNLTDSAEGKARLQSGKLVSSDEHSQQSIPPGLVYLTDIAFNTDKSSFLERLAAFPMRQGDLSILLPPFCISTRHQGEGNEWIQEGRTLADAASRASAPVLIIGPASFMNRPTDIFKTYLPGGYLFAAHFLSRPNQEVRNHFVPVQSSGRFRVIGYGAAKMRESLERVVWGEKPEDTYAFAVDFYLYIVLIVLATAARRGGALNRAIHPRDYYACFHFIEGKTLNRYPHESSRAINGALLGGDALRFAMEQDLSKGGRLLAVNLKPEEASEISLKVNDVAWFSKARINMGIEPVESFAAAGAADR